MKQRYRVNRRLTSSIWLTGVVLAGVMAGAAAQAQAADKVVFSADFGSTALLAEKWKLIPASKWKIEAGALASLVEGGSRGAVAQVKYDGPVKVRLRIKSPNLMAGQWCGVTVGGIHFTLVPGGYWYVYRTEGAKRSLGNSVADPIKPDTWYAFEITHRGDVWKWRVNGKLVVEFREMNPILGANQLLSVDSSGSPIVVDDVQVIALSGDVDTSPNLLDNASFEQPIPDYIPPGWKPSRISEIPPEILWRDWRVVKGDAFQGNNALRLNGGHKEGNGVSSNDTGIIRGRPATFSVYLKANKPDTKAQLQIWELWSKSHVKAITVGTQWKRYSITAVPRNKSIVRAGVSLLSHDRDTLLLVDAGQLEEGTAPTKFQLSSMGDEESGGDPYASLPIPKPVNLVVADKAPTLDGKLDDPCWSDASKLWPLLQAKAKAPVEPTDAYAVFHDGTLYIAMRCHESKPDSIKAKPHERDDMAIFNDDHIEIFLDLDGDPADYYQLAVNPADAIFDAGPGRNAAWNGQWEAKAHRGGDSWSVEVALPLASLNLSPMVGHDWKINLGRYELRLGEISSTALSFAPNFHIPQRFPSLILPETVDLARYYILPDQLAVVHNAATGKAHLAGVLRNRTGKDLSLKLDGQLGGEVNWQLAQLAVPANGETPFSIPLSKMPAATGGVSGLNATIRTTGDSPRVLRWTDQKVPVRPVLDCLLERSIYTTQRQAAVIGTLRLSPEELAGATLRVDPIGKTFTQLSPRLDLSIPIDKLPPGDHSLTVTLANAQGRTLATHQLTLRKLPPGQPAVAVDRIRRCLIVDGQPYLAIAPLYGFFDITPLKNIDRMMNVAADSGYRTVMIVGKIENDAYLERWARVFEMARRRHLMVVAWPNGYRKQYKAGTLDKKLGAFIDQYKSNPQLLAWLLVDEPELSHSEEAAKAALSLAAQRDPYHPSYMNNTVLGIPSRFAGLPGNILSIDDYLTNRPHRKVIEMARDVRMINKVAVPTHRPTWMFLSGNNLQNHRRLPTAGEQVAQTYGTVIEGATGLYYFLGTIDAPKVLAATEQTNRELMTLTPVILSDQPAPAVRSAAPAVLVASRRVGDYVYLICVNVEDKPVDARLHVDLQAGDIDGVTLFENRLVTVKDGWLKDKFEGHQRHVYRLALPKSEDSHK